MRFTLIEMLIVIAIIAILSALVLPALHRARDLGVKTSCGNNLRQVGVIMGSYGNDFSSAVPPARFMLIGGYQRTFASGLAGYADLPGARGYLQYVTPSMLDAEGRHAKFASRENKTVFTCPGDPYPEPDYQWDFAISYGMNFLRMPDQFYPGYLPFIKIGSLRYPSRCAAVADTQGIVLTGERHLYFGSGSALLNYGRNHAGTGNYLYFSGNLGSSAPLDIPSATSDPFWRGL